MHQLI